MKKLIQLFTKLQVIPMVCLSPLAFAQQEIWGVLITEKLLFWCILFIEGCLILITLLLFFIVRMMAGHVLFPTKPAEAAEQIAPAEEKHFLKRMLTKLNDAVPVAREQEVMTAHAYDGIYELDNNLPPWWKALFYITIVFGVVYLLHFHVLSTGDLQAQEYEKEMATAKAEIEAYLASSANNVDENNATIIRDPARLEGAQEMYTQKCAPCHGQFGEGGVGPNLTDAYWLHGGDVKDIFRTIKNGVPEKGMIPWKTQLSPVQIQDIASYIISLEGSHPPNAKEPQGELYERTETVSMQ